MAQNKFRQLVRSLLGETVQLNLNETPAPAAEAGGGHLTLLNLENPAPLQPIVEKAPAAAEQVEKAANAAMPVEKAALDVPAATVIELGTSSAIARVERQPNIKLFRGYAKHSAWVRAAIDYHRRVLGRAVYAIVPIDLTARETRIDKRVKAEVENLLQHPNEAEESYGFLKEQMIEDYLVVGHGCLELELRRDMTPYGMRVLDAATIGFVKTWDGTDMSVPRFVEFADMYASRVKRYLAHQQVFCLVNRPMSDTKLGYSHVEALHKTVMALLGGDDQLIREILQPKTNKLINLGEGVTAQQVEAFKYELQQVEDALAVIGGGKNPAVLDLAGNAAEMKVLDSQEWFVRQVAAIFGISTAKLKLAVDTSNANTKEMYEDDIEAVAGEIVRIQELETSVFIKRYSYLGDVNLTFSYPILHRKDEKQQAFIAKQSTGMPWASINEARSRTGEKEYDEKDMPHCNEPLVPIGKGQVLPWSVWNKWVENFEKNIGKEPPAPGAPPAAGNGQTDSAQQSEQ